MAEIADLATIKKRKEDIVGALGERNTEFDAYERVYKIEPSGADEGKTDAKRARPLYDAHGHNTIDATVRMYSVDKPSITIAAPPSESAADAGAAKEIADQRRNADKVEQFLNTALDASNLVSEQDFIADSLFAASIYGELPQILDNVLGELPEGASQDDVEAPFVFEVPHPKDSYPRYSRRHGLLEHVFQETVTLAEVRNHYGEKATAFLNGDDSTEVTLVDYMNLPQHTVYVEEQAGQAVLEVPLSLGFLPRTSRKGVSPGFFKEEKYQRMPMLYAYLKANMWAARNIAFTAANTNIMDYLNPIMLHVKKAGSDLVEIDWAKRGSTVGIEEGESLGPLARNLVPPEFFNYLGLLGQMVEGATMPRVIQGAAPGGISTTSGLNLLTASATVATFLIARVVEMATAQTLSKMLRWIKARGQPVSIWGERGKLTLAPSEIGDLWRQVRVRLKKDRSAEKSMIAGLATSLFQGLHLGYDETLEMLESGGIIQSAQAAFDSIVERAMIESELPALAKESAESARTIMGAVAKVPMAPGAPTPGAGPEVLGPNPNQVSGAAAGIAPDMSGAGPAAPGGVPLPPV